MKEKVFVLAANRYNFVDQTTGEIRKGTTVYYVNGLEPVSPSDTQKGCVPIKANFNYEAFGSFDKVPGNYTIDYTQSANSRGQVKLIYNSVSKA